MEANWKCNIINGLARGSRTPGSTKGDNCKASKKERFMAKRSRSYKHPEYENWCESTKNALR